MKILFELFKTFAKIGMFTFGGGYAMIAMIDHACVEEKKWITHEELMDMTVVAESTPGPIAINCATFTGFKIAGLPGAVAATVGMIVPSLVIIYLISMFLENFLELTIIANAFRGIKIAVGLLILEAGINMVKKAKKTTQTKIIIPTACAIMLLAHVLAWNLSPISLMITAGVVSLAVFALGEKGGKAK